MRCIMQSSQEPSPIHIEARGNIFDIWLRQDIREVEATEEGETYTYWVCDEAYMQALTRPEITAENFDTWFAKAVIWTEPSDEPEEGLDDLLLELAADHEERICMLELFMEE